MTPKGAPPTNLNVIKPQNPPSHPVPTVPLKPTAFIGIAVRITQGPVIMIIRATSTCRRWRPPVQTPNRQRLTRLDAKQITVSRIRTLGRQTTKMKAAPKPFRRKFRDTVVQISPLEDAEQQHFSRRQIGGKGGIPCQRAGLLCQHIRIRSSQGHFVTDTYLVPLFKGRQRPTHP